jgi:plastocyanin
MKCHTAFVFSFLLLLLLMFIFPASVIMSSDHRYEASAQNANSLESEKVLIEDVIQDLQKNNTKSASMHLDLAQRQLTLLPSNSTSVETATLLLEDANKALKSNDYDAAILHLKLADKQISTSVPLVTNKAENIKPPKEAASVGPPTIINLTILEGAATQGNPAYDPNPLQLRNGETIQVTNKDNVPHTVTNGKSPDDPNSAKLFDTSIINGGESAKIDSTKLSAEREYPFYCVIHPYMKGILKTVRFNATSVKSPASLSSNTNLTITSTNTSKVLLPSSNTTILNRTSINVPFFKEIFDQTTRGELIFQSHIMRKDVDPNAIDLVGEIRNNSTSDAGSVTIFTTYYDKNNITIGTKIDYSRPANIPARDSAPYEIIVGLGDNVPVKQIDHVKYHLEWQCTSLGNLPSTKGRCVAS